VRAALDEIAVALGCETRSAVQLPKGHEEFEDFVEGTLHVGNEVLHVYFEHALGYLAPSGKDQATLRRT
jgi:hypothetical protein